jgi:hypothetical protein
LLFDYGIDNIGTNIKFLRGYDKETAKGWYSFNGKRYRFSDMIKYVENKDLEKELDEGSEISEKEEESGEFQTITCPKCGFKNKSDAWYCENCGTELISPE